MWCFASPSRCGRCRPSSSATASVLVAARNFQSAWLMRSLGEETYRDWHVERIQETPVRCTCCACGQTVLTAAVGAGLMYFGGWRLVPLAIGMGIDRLRRGGGLLHPAFRLAPASRRHAEKLESSVFSRGWTNLSSWPPGATSSPSRAACWRTSKPRSPPTARCAARANRSCSNPSRAASIWAATRSSAATPAPSSGRPGGRVEVIENGKVTRQFTVQIEPARRLQRRCATAWWWWSA